MNGSYSLYTGNCPKSVSKDAKYVIRSVSSESVVTVTYVAPNGERWLATTEEHPDLVRIVNNIKTGAGERPNGPFYINEFGQVIVPVGQDATYYLADEEYDLPLRFEFEGNVISGEGIDLQGRPLKPGDLWTGPHPGIPYVLEPGMRDIRYESNPRPMVTRRVRLSQLVGVDQASAMAEHIGRVKGWKGGRFYINEWKEMFAPLTVPGDLEYRYIGHLEEDDPWFPKPAMTNMTFKYRFKVRSRVVHYGITTNLKRREREHQRRWPEGHIEPVGEPTTHGEAWEWERQQAEHGSVSAG